jgi:hypothetical protein
MHFRQACIALQMQFPEIEKQRQAKRNSDREQGQNGQPPFPAVQSPPFHRNEFQHHQRGDDYIHTEKGADPVNEEFVEEERAIQKRLM